MFDDEKTPVQQHWRWILLTNHWYAVQVLVYPSGRS
jgi:hypothetical protein